MRWIGWRWIVSNIIGDDDIDDEDISDNERVIEVVNGYSPFFFFSVIVVCHR